MGERTRSGPPMGRFAALCVACAGAALCHPQDAAAQTPQGDKAAAGLGGAVVHFEESAGRGILYFEQKGGLVTSAPAALELSGAEPPAPVATAPKAAKAVPADRRTATGPSAPRVPRAPRTPQRQATAAELAALGR